MKTLDAPNGSADNKVLTYSGAVATVIAVPQPLAQVGWGETPPEPLPPILVAAPKGTHALYSAPRMIGDWYAEFTAGKRITSAVASTQAEAVRLAAEKMAA